MENAPSSAVKEPRTGLHFASLNLLVCIQIEIEIAFPVSCFYLARLAIRERTEKMISLLRTFSSEREIRSHGSMSFCRTRFTRRSYYGDKRRRSVVAEIPGNIGCIIRLDLCETKKGNKWKSRWTWRRISLYDLKNYMIITTPIVISAIINIKYKYFCNSLLILD